MTTIDLEVSGGNVTVEDHGEGPIWLVLAGTPNSRIIRPSDEVVDRLGVRCVSLDRPGYGGSDPRRHDEWAQSAEWLEEVVDALELDRLSVLGWSGGAGHAWHLAVRLGTRCDGLTVVGGLCSVDDDRLLTSVPAESASRIRGLRRAPVRARRKMIEWALRPTAERAGQDPRVRVDELFARVGDADAEVIDTAENLELLDQDVAETFAQGVAGWAVDALLMTRAWSEERPSCAVRVLHGRDDQDVGRDSGRAIADAAAVELELTDGGHYELLASWERLLTR